MLLGALPPPDAAQLAAGGGAAAAATAFGGLGIGDIVALGFGIGILRFWSVTVMSYR